MVANPFVRLWVAPVETLTLAGYALLLLTLAVLTAGYAYRTGITLRARWLNERPRQWQYVPPAGFCLRLASIPFVLMLDAWAMAAIVYLVT